MIAYVLGDICSLWLCSSLSSGTEKNYDSNGETVQETPLTSRKLIEDKNNEILVNPIVLRSLTNDKQPIRLDKRRKSFRRN